MASLNEVSKVTYILTYVCVLMVLRYVTCIIRHNTITKVLGVIKPKDSASLRLGGTTLLLLRYSA